MLSKLDLVASKMYDWNEVGNAVSTVGLVISLKGR